MLEDTVSKRLQELESIEHSGISQKMTLNEADSIVHIYGSFVVFTGFLPVAFGSGIPDSFLPFPKPIIIGALQKVIGYYEKEGNQEYLPALRTTLSGLLFYDSDAEAFSNAASNFGNSDWRKTFVGALQERQNEEMMKGFFLNGKHWGMTQERKDELLNELNN